MKVPPSRLRSLSGAEKIGWFVAGFFSPWLGLKLFFLVVIAVGLSIGRTRRYFPVRASQVVRFFLVGGLLGAGVLRFTVGRY